MSYRLTLKTRKVPLNPLERKRSHELHWECLEGAELCVFDDGLEDGDSVAVYWGDSLLVPAMELTKDGYCFPVVCEGSSQVITIIPLNEGRIVPNTVRVQLRKEGVVMTDEILKSGKNRKIVILLKQLDP